MRIAIKILLGVMIFCSASVARNMYDDLTSNGSPNDGHPSSRKYRNGAITLHDNIFRARSVLSETGRVGAVSTQMDFYNAMSLKQQNFYQEQIKNSTHDFDFKALQNGIILDNMQFRLTKDEKNKNKK